MAYNVRYQMKFIDQLNMTWLIDFSQDNYTGNITHLVAAPDPLIIRYEGDDIDIFSQVHKSKAIINIYVDSGATNLFFETNNITDKTFAVNIYNVDKSYQWDGWLIPDERSGRLLDQGYYLQLTAIDPLSYADGAKYVHPETGQFIQGKLNIYTLLDYALRKSTNVNNTIRIRLNSVLNYEGMKAEGAPYYANLLFTVRGYAENFLQANDRPQNALEVVNRINKVFGLTVFRENLNFVFRSPMALIPETITTYTTQQVIQETLQFNVHNRAFDTAPGMLMNNSDVLTCDRPYKELSISFVYDNILSIIANANFANYDEATQTFADWTKMNMTNNVYRIGEGRPLNPYRMHIDGYTTQVSPIQPLTGMVGHSYRPILQDSILNVSIKFRWYDYKKEIPDFPANQWATMLFRLRVTDGTNTYYYFTRSAGSTSGDVGTNAAYDHWLPRENESLNPAQWSQCLVASTVNDQTMQFTTPPCPIGGTIQIELRPLLVPDPNNAVNKWMLKTDNWIEYIAVDIGEQINSQGNEITGETHYITQYQNYSQIGATENFELGDTPVETVSGALFKSGTEVAGTNNLTTTWINSVLPVKDFNLIKNMLRIWMFFARQPKVLIDCEIFSNTLKFEHLLIFKNGSKDILPGKYMQLTKEWSVRNCLHRIRAAQLTGAFNDTGTNADKYEDYFDINDNN